MAFGDADNFNYIIMRENLSQIYHPYSMFEFYDNLQSIYIENNDKAPINYYITPNAEYRNKLKRLENTTVLPDDWDNAISFQEGEVNTIAMMRTIA